MAFSKRGKMHTFLRDFFSEGLETSLGFLMLFIVEEEIYKACCIFKSFQFLVTVRKVLI
jgi:hypothetical protein